MKWTFTGLLLLCFIAVQAQLNQTDTILNRISEERFIDINGIKQWMTIKGDITKPLILFLHGGPGSPLTPYADVLFKNWEKGFVVVQWDQRDTGKTYGANAPEELTPEYMRANPLTLEQMTADGIELSRYLLTYLKKEKLILFGSSWGSVLGVKMAQQRPELFYAYIGHSQVVHPAAADLSAYNTVVQLARKEKDQTSIDILDQIGKPPYDTARNAGKFMRIVKRYQQKNASPAPALWFTLSQEYDNEKDNRHRSDGDDYSFVHYAGDKRLGISPINANINFLEDGLVSKIPVYFIQGEEDIQTPAAINKNYFDKVKAPVKKFIGVPKTDHGFNQLVIDTLYDLLKNQILSSIKGKN